MGRALQPQGRSIKHGFVQRDRGRNLQSCGMLTLVLALALLATPPAATLCAYRDLDHLNHVTTVSEEYADSAWVGRVRVASASDGLSDDPAVADGGPWSLYRLEVVETFKGEPGREARLFTERNSGGFYLETAAGPDIGGEYLLFLVETARALPAEARGAMVVNYSCGRSGPWSAVSAEERRTLLQLRDG